MRDRQQEIRQKGFSIMGNRRSYEGPQGGPVDYGKIKIGTKTLDDAVLNLGALQKINRNYGNKALILKALYEKNLPLLREISNYFYRTSGVYARACNYFAYMYRYDWYIVPEILDDNAKEEKVLTEFNKLLDYLDSSHIKKVCGDIALGVVKNGAYYGYKVETPNGIMLQELPINYCRSRFYVGNMPAIEFNMRFFDDNFRDLQYRMRVLKMFPPEFQKGYLLYKQGKLTPEYIGGDSLFPEKRYAAGSWYLLEPGSAVKFSLSSDDIPMFVNAIPSILDLDAAQDLDRRKQMQKLLKILIQKLPLDKNGDLIFDVDEARDIHNNAVEMLKRAIGVDVLTTFADVQVEDMADSNTATSQDDLEKVERTVYNEMGISRNLFNTDGNLSLEKSILNDEASIRNLLFQFHMFFDDTIYKKSSNKRKWCFRFYMLETTQYNYRELSKMYKEQVQIGYSKMLPQIALGHSQSSIIHTAHFENEVLHLSELMLPPMQSSAMNAEGLQQLSGKGTSQQPTTQKTQTKSGGDGNSSEQSAGRPEKPDDQKSTKTIQNKESMN